MMKLILEDGTTMEGRSFGAERSSAGEVVFNTAMTGYTESISDPSYSGQILVFTWPMVGNYGIPPVQVVNSLEEFKESSGIHLRGLVVADYSENHSHWNANRSLSQWLKDEGIPAISGIDTRSLTKRIREKGTLLGKLVHNGIDPGFFDPDKENLVARVSVQEKTTYGDGELSVLLIDCGVKNNIIRHLLKRGVRVTRVPWDYGYRDEEYDGILISNGPGNPKNCQATIFNIAESIRGDRPVFGICLGNQLMALAAGADTYKLKYGHRSHNQPVIMPGTDRAWITSQNHGYAIDQNTLPDDWEPLFINLNDGTNEGLQHKTKPFFSVQFHPEASGGPVDTAFLFDRFIDSIRLNKG